MNKELNQTLTLKLGDTQVHVRRDTEGRYCLNDIYKASGKGPLAKPTRYLRNKHTGVEVVRLHKGALNGPYPEDFDSYVVLTGIGRASKTFAPLRVVYKYAAYISEEFKEAIYKAFEHLAKGEVSEAANLVSEVTITPQILEKYKRCKQVLDDTLKATFPDKPHIYTNYYRLISKSVTGYAPSVLTGDNGSTIDHITEKDSLPAMNAYIAAVETTTLLLRTGFTDYHAIGAILMVETGKNKKVLQDYHKAVSV